MYFQIQGGGNRGFSPSPIEVAWERIIYDDPNYIVGSGFGIQITSSVNGALSGIVLDDVGRKVGVLTGLRSSAGVGGSVGYQWVMAAPPNNGNGTSTTSRIINYGPTDYRVETTTYVYNEAQGTVRAYTVDQSFHIAEPGEAPLLVHEGSRSEVLLPSQMRARGFTPNPRCFLAGTPILMADGTEKPIEQVRVGDMVMAFATLPDGSHGPLVPRPVKRTFENITRSIVNLRGLHVTPGHVFACGEGGFETIATILARDGTLIEQDGRRIRARTGAPFGSPEDLPVGIIYDEHSPTGPHIVTVRAGIPTGGETVAQGQSRLLTLVEMLGRVGFIATSEGVFRNAAGEPLGLSDWPAYSTPFDTSLQSDWVITRPDGQPYTPGWIRELEEEAAQEQAVGAGTRRIASGSGAGAPRSRPMLVGGGHGGFPAQVFAFLSI